MAQDIRLRHNNQVGMGFAQRRMAGGVAYLVSPVVAVVAGVLNGELLTAEEIAKSAPAWEGQPVTVGHPMRGGRYVSATEAPEAVIGTLRAVRMVAANRAQPDRLLGEIWIDAARAEALGGDAAALAAAVAAGMAIEVSTGYWCEFSPEKGVFNGREYAGIQRDLQPDHLALLLNEDGACSWADGCGTPRVNQADGRDGVMVAFYPAPDDAAALALLVGDMPRGSEVAPANELHLTLAYLGTVDELAGRVDELGLLQAVGGFAQAMPVLRGEASGVGRFAGDEGGGMQALYASFDGPMLPEWRQALVEMLEFGVGAPVRREHGFTPHITLAYVPADAATELRPDTPRPLVFDRVSVVWGDRRTDFPLSGEAVTGAALAANLRRGCGCKREEREMQVNEQERDVQVNEQEAVVEETALDEAVESQSDEQAATMETAEVVEAAPVANAQAAVPAEVVEVAALIRDLGGVGAVKEALTLLRANRDETQARLVDELTANQACAFSRADLEAMNVEHLQKLAQSLRTPSYAGRGGVRTNQQDEWVVYEPPTAAK